MTESQYLYHWRRKHGLCGHCGNKPALKGRSMCEKCLEKHRQSSQKQYKKHSAEIRAKAHERYVERREKALASGMCTKCFVRPAENGYRHCWRCRANNKTAYRTPKPYDKAKRKEYVKKRRERLISEHICINCGKRPTKDNRQKCGICAARHNRRQNELNWQKGTTPRFMGGDGTHCAICLKPDCNGEKLCPSCLANSRESIKKARLASGKHGGWVEIRFETMSGAP